MSTPASAIELCWAEGVQTQLADDALSLRRADAACRIAPAPPRLVAAARALEDGATWPALVARVDGAPLAPAQLRVDLERLAAAGWLRSRQRHDARLVAELAPGASGIRLPRAAPTAPAMLSRFTYARAESGRLVARSPASRYALVLHHPVAAALLSELATPSEPAAIAARAGVALEVAADFVALLAAAELLAVDGADPAPPAWEFHDLLFHAHSRPGRATAAPPTKERERIPALPAVVARAAASSIALAVPDRARAATVEPPFADVVETRASRRHHGEPPIARDTLGELLYRCARTRSLRRAGPFEVASRPYPSAGALYEQEIYVAVDRARDLDPGLYGYDGVAHALAPIAAMTLALATLLDDAARAMGVSERPQALLIVTARFARVMQKYDAIAYALILKSAGALLQTFGLVAHAMGLAGCPVGAGNADAFAAVAGTSFFDESSVAEFAVGTRAAEVIA